MITFNKDGLTIQLETGIEPQEFYSLLLKQLTFTLRCKHDAEKEFGHDSDMWVLYELLEGMLPNPKQAEAISKLQS